VAASRLGSWAEWGMRERDARNGGDRVDSSVLPRVNCVFSGGVLRSIVECRRFTSWRLWGDPRESSSCVLIGSSP
jgi:hypothetical protein